VVRSCRVLASAAASSAATADVFCSKRARTLDPPLGRRPARSSACSLGHRAAAAPASCIARGVLRVEHRAIA
jgi:hypothetical protein